MKRGRIRRFQNKLAREETRQEMPEIDEALLAVLPAGHPERKRIAAKRRKAA